MESKQSVLSLLKKIAEELQYVDHTIAVEEVSDANIMSSLFHAAITAPKQPDLKLFAKVATWNDNLRKIAAFRPFNTELHFYTKLQKKFEILEEKNKVPQEDKFRAPRFYGCSDEYLKETVVLEDLIAQGFENFNRENSADLEYMTAGIELMAQFHALSMAYYQNDQEEFRRTSEYVAVEVPKFEAFMATTKTKTLENAFKAAEGQHKAKLEKYFGKQHPERFEELIDNYRCFNRNILVHGDFKPSNLMHRRKNGKLEVVVIDFQMIHDGEPIVDLLYFIYTATDEEFRRAHYQELLDLYYERLQAATLRLRVDLELIYPESAFREQLKKSSMLGLVMAVALLPVVLVEEDKAPEFEVEDAGFNEFVPEGGPLFKKRFNGVLNNYVEWGLL